MILPGDLEVRPPIPGESLDGYVAEITAANDLGLSPEILATRRDLEQLADGRRDVAILQGWRREVIGDRMLSAL